VSRPASRTPWSPAGLRSVASGPPTLSSRRPAGSIPSLRAFDRAATLLPTVRQTVRQEQVGEAHVSATHTGAALPLSCGEADNHGEVDPSATSPNRRFQRSG
jgi:hypothetical protein